MPRTGTHLMWFDFETTGLDVIDGPDHILEVGFGMTDVRLNDVTHPAAFFVTHPGRGEMRALADPFVQEMHDASGLWGAFDAAQAVGTALPLEVIETTACRQIDNNVSSGSPVVLAGCGVSTFDYPIIKEFMPRLADQLAYYTYDVSVFERIVQSFMTDDIRGTAKSAAHRAVDDIDYAIQLARDLRRLMRGADVPWWMAFPDWKGGIEEEGS